MAAGELGPGGHCSEWGAEDRSGCRPLPAWGCPRTKPYPSISLELETGARSSWWGGDNGDDACRAGLLYPSAPSA